MTDGERVCFTEYDHLVCLGGADGGEVLDVDLPGPATPPALAGDTLVVAVDDDNVYGYSLDGDLLWEATDLQDVDFGLAVSAGDPLAVAGNVLVVPLGLYGSAGTLAIDAGTGREVWRADGSAPGELISDGQPFHGEGAGVVAVDPTTGATLWQAAADTSGTRWLESATTFADVTAVALGFGGEGAETVVVDAATGAVRWQVETVSGGLAHLDGVTVVSSDTSLRGYDAEGVRLWTTDLPASGQQYDDDETPWEGDMVVAGGRLYVLGLDLVALDVTAGAAEIVTPRSSPSDVVATASHLVVPGQVWEARPL